MKKTEIKTCFFFEKTHWVQSDRTQSGPPCFLEMVICASFTLIIIISIVFVVMRQRFACSFENFF